MKTAIVTLVMKGSSYVPGAVALAHSARIFSKARLVCMVTADVKERQPLLDAFDEVVEVEYLSAAAPQMRGRQQQKIYGKWVGDAPTKWRCLGLTDYDKVLFLDADTLILKPIDSLFALSCPAGVFDHHMAKQYVRQPGWSGTKEEGREGLDNPYLLPGKKFMVHQQQVATNVVKDLYTKASQFAVQGGIMLLEPSRFALDLLVKEKDAIVSRLPAGTISAIDEILLSLFYVEHGYKWTHVSISYNVAAFHLYRLFRQTGRDVAVVHFITPYKPWVETREQVKSAFPQHLEVYDLWQSMYKNTYLPISGTLANTLATLLGNVLGPRGKDAVRRAYPTFQKAFVSKDKNPVANYELLEAIGDRFLNGHYMWILIGTPGILTPDQVMKISSFYQNNEQLATLVEKMGLTKHIVASKLDEKLVADVFESLVGAIGIVFENLYGQGDKAIRKFLEYAYSLLPPIDPEGYIREYATPSERMNTVIQDLFLNRDNLSVAAQRLGGKVVATLSYGTVVIGRGEASTQGVFEGAAERTATQRAYKDALDTNALSQFINRKL